METNTPRRLNDTLFEALWKIAANLERENKLEFDMKSVLLGSYLKIFFIRIMEEVFPDYNLLEEGDSQSGIVQAFKIDLEAYIRVIDLNPNYQVLTPKDFAEKQSLDLSYFSDVIIYKTGAAVIDWIDSKILQLAKHMLITTNKPLKEIADRLGYAELHEFTNLFKRHCGYTPGLYRRTNTKSLS